MPYADSEVQRAYFAKRRAVIAAQPKPTLDSKVCVACQVDKPPSDFYRMSTSRDGLQSYCKPCNRSRRRDALIREHGLTPERFAQMVIDQGGKCAICGLSPRRQGTVTWVIDHNHDCCPGETGCGDCVRGLLCNGCNRAMGMFGDDPDALLAAAAYLLVSKGGPK